MNLAQQLKAASAQYFRDFAHLAHKEEEQHQRRSEAQKKKWNKTKEKLFLKEAIVQRLPKGEENAVDLAGLKALFEPGTIGISSAISKLILQKRINRIGVQTRYRYFTD